MIGSLWERLRQLQTLRRRLDFQIRDLELPIAQRIPTAASFDQQWQTRLGLKRDVQTDDLSAIAGGRFAIMRGAMR